MVSYANILFKVVPSMTEKEIRDADFDAEDESPDSQTRDDISMPMIKKGAWMREFSHFTSTPVMVGFDDYRDDDMVNAILAHLTLHPREISPLPYYDPKIKRLYSSKWEWV
jgi:hypothetical protein